MSYKNILFKYFIKNAAVQNLTENPIAGLYEDKNNLIKNLKDVSLSLAGTGAVHRVGLSAATNAVRRIPFLAKLTRPYYVNAARAGLNAGLTGMDVLPKYRRALGSAATGLSGLGEYEMAQNLAIEAKHIVEKNLKQKIKPNINWNEFLTLTEKVPAAKKLLQQFQQFNISKLNSPLSKNLAIALNKNKLPQSKLWNFIEGLGKGKDKQTGILSVAVPAQMLMGAGIHSLAGGGLHGAAIGSLGGLLNSIPELTVLKYMNSNNIKPIAKLKQGVMGEGASSAYRNADNNFKYKIKRFGLNLFDPFTKEVADMGRDFGTRARIQQSRNAYPIPKPLVLNEINKRMVQPARNNWLGRVLVEKPINE